jgi:cytochrome o ubiquinol oxidase operon protein cyoD
LLAFWVVMTHQYSKLTLFTVVYTAAIIQFFVQVICFLRLNTQTPQARTNVMSIVFTIVILITIVIGSLWIMGNLNINMM